MGNTGAQCGCDRSGEKDVSTDILDSVVDCKTLSTGRRANAVPLVLISDPGQDLDDEMTYIMLRHLTEIGVAEVKGIITTLHPSFDRARLCRGTLDVLGMFGVSIGVGSDGGDVTDKHKASTFIEWARPYMPPRFSAPSDAFKPGFLLLHSLYTDAAPRSLTLVIIAALKDPALFLRDEEQLFKAKTREVVIMGGVEPWDEEAANGTTVLVPDTANNNTFDMEAARFFHQRCQELGVPLIIVSRWAAYAAKVPRSCYDELASTGSWIGCRLRNAQRASIEGLWDRAASPAGSEARQGLPDRCDRAWFLKTFCAGADAAGRAAGDTIWDLVAGFMQYDAVATLAAIPPLRDRFFAPVSVKGLHGVEHRVVGCTEEDHNIHNIDELMKFLNVGFRKGLAYNHHRKSQFILMLQPRWSNRAENLLLIVVFRTLFDLGIFDCAGIVLHPVPSNAKYISSTSTVSSSFLTSQAFSKDDDGIREFAREMKSLLAALGLSHVAVLVVGPELGPSGTDHLHELYKKTTPAGISLVVTGSLDIVADFAEEYSKDFFRKTQRVILLGGAVGVPEKDAAGVPTGHMILEPNPEAQNNLLDMKSAQRFYQTAQRLLVPLVVVTRHFVHALQIPRAFYDVLGDSSYGGTVGKQLYDSQRNSVTQLWAAVRAPSGDTEARRNLPDRCDRAWFVKSFLTALPASDSDDDLWKSTRSFNIYNLHAILLALPPVVKSFVKGTPIKVRSVEHHIVGSSSDDPGVLNRGELTKLILQCIVTGTRLNSSLFGLKVPPAIQLDTSGNSARWQYDSHREALSWLLPSENTRGTTSDSGDPNTSQTADIWSQTADLWDEQSQWNGIDV